jgi:hypothetical protein
MAQIAPVRPKIPTKSPQPFPISHTLSKSVGLGPPWFKRVRDLGRLNSMVRAERPRT